MFYGSSKLKCFLIYSHNYFILEKSYAVLKHTIFNLKNKSLSFHYNLVMTINNVYYGLLIM